MLFPHISPQGRTWALRSNANVRPSGKYAVLSLARQSDILRTKNTERFIGQIMAFGIYLEAFLKIATSEEREQIKDRIKEILSGRNLDRALSGIKRIEKE